MTKAGTVIFLASIAMWLLLNFGIHGYTNEMSESFGAAIGHFIVPVLKPIGLGYWQIAVALIAGISAKEVVVSSCAVLFGIANVNSAAGMGALHQALGAARIWYGKCLLSYDFLPAVYPLFCYAGNDS